MKSRIVFGFGINDADYVVQKNIKVNGKWVRDWICPYYSRWVDMIRRCYSARELKRKPTYTNVTVCEEWRYFSCFRKWMVDNFPVCTEFVWQLDKDISVQGSSVYCPDTCLFLPSHVNKLLLDSAKVRGKYPLGVAMYGKHGRFRGECGVGESRSKYLGTYDDPASAHKAWQMEKLNVIRREYTNVLNGMYDKPNLNGDLIKLSVKLQGGLDKRIECLLDDIALCRETICL